MLFGTSDDSADECEALSQFIRGLLKNMARVTSVKLRRLVLMLDFVRVELERR
jgi:hypothetical protein